MALSAPGFGPHHPHHNHPLPLAALTRNFGSDLYPFRNLLAPYLPFNNIGPRRISDGGRHAFGLRSNKGIAAFSDKSIEAPGDLGWTLDYATAWLYRYLTSNQPGVCDIIDTARELDLHGPHMALFLFDALDRAVFGHKLKDAVYLRWRPMTSCSPGTTSASDVVPGIPRVCIELNSTPFMQQIGMASIDELLEPLIHHMIHAYFLVCCGNLQPGEKNDGRLMDGLHFGVILNTIRELTRSCSGGVLPFIFHASKRRKVQTGPPCLEGNATGLLSTWTGRPYPGSYSISLDPRGADMGSSTADGRTHCLHDNRAISRHMLQNWQVTDYSRALKANMEAKGDTVWDFSDGLEFVETLRVKGPPSATYIELIWDDMLGTGPKRIMANREKALAFDSLRGPLQGDLEYELEVPPCDIDTFRCIYDFINKDGYLATPQERLLQWPLREGQGPAILFREHEATRGLIAPDVSIITHIKVFKAAESMRFEELMKRALEQMDSIPMTMENPMALFRALYNDEQAPPGPIHAALHRWSRKFMIRTEDDTGAYTSYLGPHHDILHRHRPGASRGPPPSNIEKVADWFPDPFLELYHRSSAFREDVNIARGLLRSGLGWHDLVNQPVRDRRPPPFAPPPRAPSSGGPAAAAAARGLCDVAFVDPDDFLSTDPEHDWRDALLRARGLRRGRSGVRQGFRAPVGPLQGMDRVGLGVGMRLARELEVADAFHVLREVDRPDDEMLRGRDGLGGMMGGFL